MSNIEIEDQLVKEMSEFLYYDFNEGIDLLSKNDSQYLRRSFIRSLFAAIESVIFGMKTEILNRLSEANPPFTTGELVILEEKSFTIDKSGDIIESPKYLELKKNIRFVFRTYGKCYGTQLELDVSGTDWKNFTELVEVRNRITHPKTKNDIIITDDEINKSKLLFGWFSKQHINSVTVTTDALKNKIEILKKQLPENSV
ncbi:MAG: hypothetical protein FD122_2032 [Stygiobacter sp.]|nr:MAG: hypothetical protein FD122_2032 [Stygiobacter sp.]KAF0214502.1 MAG: hypothetical protein FD178_2376 [Ignavibacteria bacterium]